MNCKYKARDLQTIGNNDAQKKRTLIVVLRRHNETQVREISDVCNMLGLMGVVVRFPLVHL